MPLSLFQTIWRLSTGSETSQVINGILVLAPAGWPEVAVTALLWTWALAAGVFALGRAVAARAASSSTATPARQ